MWQSGPVETLVDQLVDTVKDLLPFGGLGFDLVEQFDRMVEGFARSQLRWGWDEMKENARAASLPIADAAAIQWPPTSSAATDAMAAMPGASLLVDGLARYVERHDPRNVRIHLAGHSAGSIFHAALLDRLASAGLAVDTMSWMAPGITVDEFAERALPHIGPGKTVRRFTCFNLSDRLELDDDLGLNGFTIYHKSILYLVSRAFERPVGGATEVPLVGMTRSWDQPFRGSPDVAGRRRSGRRLARRVALVGAGRRADRRDGPRGLRRGLRDDDLAGHARPRRHVRAGPVHLPGARGPQRCGRGAVVGRDRGCRSRGRARRRRRPQRDCWREGRSPGTGRRLDQGRGRPGGRSVRRPPIRARRRSGAAHGGGHARRCGPARGDRRAADAASRGPPFPQEDADPRGRGGASPRQPDHGRPRRLGLEDRREGVRS